MWDFINVSLNFTKVFICLLKENKFRIKWLLLNIAKQHLHYLGIKNTNHLKHLQMSAAESLSSAASSHGAGAESLCLSDDAWETIEDVSIDVSSSESTTTVTPGVTIMGRDPLKWVPDHSAPNCHGCHRSFVLFFRRKHHCRLVYYARY